MIAGAGLGVAGAAGAVALWRGPWLDPADKLASVLALLVGAVSLAILIRDRGRAGPDEAQLLDQATERLAVLVRAQWYDEAGARRLRDPRPIRLRWSTSGRAVAASPEAVLGVRDGVGGRPLRIRLAGGLPEVAATVRWLPRHQLVVLGDPGAGKTVLAMLFVLDELAQRAPGDAVPVLLPVADWDPGGERFGDWLARRIAAEYPGLRDTRRYGEDAAVRLVREGRVLPVLDGLDEMPAKLAPVAVAAINAAAGVAGLVVTCRSDDYELIVEQADTVLGGAAVIEVLPVAAADAVAYLTGAHPQGGERWQPVVHAIREEPSGALATTLASPLMISICRAVYAAPAADPAELLSLARTRSPDELRRELLERYVPALYGSDQPLPPAAPARRGYPPEKAEVWLGFLAVHLVRNLHGSPNLSWWQLATAVRARTVGVVAGSGAGALAGVLVMLSLLSIVPARPLTEVVRMLAAMGAAAAILVGVVVGLTAMRSVRAMARQADPAGHVSPAADRSAWRRGLSLAGQALRDAILVGPLAGFVFVGLAPSDEEIVLVILTAAAVLAGVTAGLGVDAVIEPRRMAVRLRNWRRVSGRLCVAALFGMMVAVPFAANFATDSGFDGTPTTRVLATLLSGAGIGLAAIGLPMVLAHVLQTTVDQETATTPGTVLRADRTVFAAILLGAGLSIGLPFAAVAVLMGEPDTALFSGVTIAVMLGLVTASAAAPARVPYLAARLVLAARGLLPWSLMRFLADAHQREVLRRAGSFHQFRHLLLRDELARRREVTAPASRTGRLPELRRVRAGLRRAATAVPLLLLVYTSAVGADKALSDLRSDAADALLEKGADLAYEDPVTAMRAWLAVGVFDGARREAEFFPDVLHASGLGRVTTLRDEARAVHVSRRGDRLAANTWLGDPVVYRIDAGGALRDPVQVPIPGPRHREDYLRGFAFDEAGVRFGTLHAEPPRVILWSLSGDARTVARRGGFPVQRTTHGIAVSGDTVSAIDADGSVRRYRWRAGRAEPAATIGPPPQRAAPDPWRLLEPSGTVAVERLTPGSVLTARSLVGGAPAVRFEGSENAEAAALSADSAELAVVGTRAVGIYDRRTGAPTFPVGALLPEVTDVALTSGRLFLLRRGRVMVIDREALRRAMPTPDRLRPYLCDRAGQGLDREQWAELVPYGWLPGLRHRPTCP